MSRIVFFCIPAHGHTNPTLNVVRELVGRGHEVLYYSYDLMREKIEATGARFVACDDYDMERRIDPRDAARMGKDLAFSTQILVDTTLALDEMVMRDMAQLQPDCIVADSMAVWGKAAAMKLGIPFVSSTTTFAFNKYSARIMKQSAAQLFSMLFSMPRIQHNVRRLQKAGYPVKSVLDLIQNDDQTHTVVYTSPQFQPCSETFSAEHYTFVGPSIRSAEETIEKRRKNLIYISMGTVNNNMVPLYKACISALAKTDWQGILSVGYEVDPAVFGDLPENIAVFPHVDQIGVLEKADVFVSHCGMNSVSESLYYGVPLVMLPQTSEQEGVAARVAQLGAGVRPEKTTPEELLNAVKKLIEDPSYGENAKKIGEGFRNCSGARGAAEKILSMCK